MRHAQDVDVLDRETPKAPSRPLRLAIPTALVVVVADQLTKRWALSALEPGSCSQSDACIELFAGIKFHLVFNTGAAFTRGSGYGPLLGVLAIVMSAFLLYLAGRRADRLGAALFGAIAGGAIGNLLDRIFRAEDGVLSGAVVDFIDVGWWPVFNVADSAIVVGVIAVIVMSFFEHTPADAADPRSPDLDDVDVDVDVDDDVADDVDVADLETTDSEHAESGESPLGDSEVESPDLEPADVEFPDVEPTDVVSDDLGPVDVEPTDGSATEGGATEGGATEGGAAVVENGERERGDREVVESENTAATDRPESAGPHDAAPSAERSG